MVLRLFVVVLSLALIGCDYRIVDERPPLTPTPIVQPPAPTPPVVTVPAPTINLFIAEPARVFLLGGRISLRWDVSLPPGTPINTPVAVRIDPLPGTVPAIGATIVQPFDRGITTFILLAQTAGGLASRTVQIAVE